MKITKSAGAPRPFVPYVINIVVESKLEQTTLRSMAGANIRIPDAVFLACEEFSASEGNIQVCKDMLNKLANAIDE